MISFITNLLRAVFFGYLLNDYLKSRYPKKYETFIISFSYNLIYVYSKVQIFYMNIVKTVNKKIEETPKLLKLKNDLDLLLNKKNGTVIMIECIKNGILSDNLSMTECDFALYSRLDDSNKCLNKKIVYDLDESIDVYEVSDIKFLLVEMKIGAETYKIEMKTDAYNFYIVGNRFTKQFFQYYLTEILKQRAESLDNFSLHIIDHDVNKVQLDFSDENTHILLEKTGYKMSIVNNENHINNNNEENEEKE
jgi:hypothetical protein